MASFPLEFKLSFFPFFLFSVGWWKLNLGWTLSGFECRLGRREILFDDFDITLFIGNDFEFENEIFWKFLVSFFGNRPIVGIFRELAISWPTIFLLKLHILLAHNDLENYFEPISFPTLWANNIKFWQNWPKLLIGQRLDWAVRPCSKFKF